MVYTIPKYDVAKWDVDVWATGINLLQPARLGAFRLDTARLNYFPGNYNLFDVRINGASIMDILEKKTLRVDEQLTTKTSNCSFNLLGNAVSVEPNTITGNIAVGTSPKWIAINGTTKKAYVSNTSAGTVSVIDLTTNLVTATIGGIANANYIAIDETSNKIYVSQSAPTNQVIQIDGATNLIIQTLMGFNNPNGIAVDIAFSEIYICDTGNGQVLIYDTNTWLKIETYPLTNGPTDLIYNAAEREIYVSGPTTLSLSWTGQVSGTANALNGIAWSNTQFCTVGAAGTILTSPTGITWTSRTSGTANAMNAIIWNGNIFCAIGAAGTILTSPDGVTWTARTSGTANNLAGIAWNGSLFAVVGATGTILTSPDGVTWTARTSGTANNLAGIAWNGSLFAVVGATGTILTSPDGITWTIQTSGTANNLFCITWNGLKFAAGGASNTGLYSSNGTAWNLTAIGGIADTIRAIIWSGNQFLAVGNSAYTSLDGITWTLRNAMTAQSNGMIYSSNLNLFMVVENGGAIQSSPDEIGNVANIDTVLGSITYIPVGGTPAGLAFDSRLNKIYLINSGTQSVAIIDGTTNAVQSMVTGLAANPKFAAVDTTNHRLYVTHTSGTNTVSVIDLLTNTIKTQIAMGTTTLGVAIKDATRFHTVYAVKNATNNVAIINPFSQVSAEPELGSILEIFTGGGLYWAGIITATKEKRLHHGAVDPTNQFKVQCKAMDYTRLLTKKRIKAQYFNQYSGDIVRAIISDSSVLADGFTAGNIDQGPLLSYINFDYRTVFEAIKQVADTVYFNWEVTPGKLVNFSNPVVSASVYTITDGSNNYRDLEIEKDISQVRNLILVRGAKKPIAGFTEDYIGDGAQTRFPLGEMPTAISVTVNSIIKSVGIENIDTGKDCYVNYANAELTFAVAPAASAAIHISYSRYIPTLKKSQNSNTGFASQIKIAALEGGTGIYEHFVEDSTLIDIESAINKAEGELAQFCKPILRGRFSSWNSNLNNGNYITINLSDRNINQVVQIINKSTSLIASQKLVWDYQFTSNQRDKYITLMQKLLNYTQPQNQFTNSTINEVVDPNIAEITII